MTTIPLVAFFVAAALVARRQCLRLRDARQLPLALMLALLALAHGCGAGGRWNQWWHLAAGAAGLAQVLALAPRHHPHGAPHPPAAS